ncbi:hypothetical protein HDU76_006413, partial [Blyttiomyces sp. JEL0837]
HQQHQTPDPTPVSGIDSMMGNVSASDDDNGYRYRYPLSSIPPNTAPTTMSGAPWSTTAASQQQQQQQETLSYPSSSSLQRPAQIRTSNSHHSSSQQQPPFSTTRITTELDFSSLLDDLQEMHDSLMSASATGTGSASFAQYKQSIAGTETPSATATASAGGTGGGRIQSGFEQSQPFQYFAGFAGTQQHQTSFSAIPPGSNSMFSSGVGVPDSLEQSSRYQQQTGSMSRKPSDNGNFDSLMRSSRGNTAMGGGGGGGGSGSGIGSPSASRPAASKGTATPIAISTPNEVNGSGGGDIGSGGDNNGGLQSPAAETTTRSLANAASLRSDYELEYEDELVIDEYDDDDDEEGYESEGSEESSGSGTESEENENESSGTEDDEEEHGDEDIMAGYANQDNVDASKQVLANSENHGGRPSHQHHHHHQQASGHEHHQSHLLQSDHQQKSQHHPSPYDDDDINAYRDRGITHTPVPHRDTQQDENDHLYPEHDVDIEFDLSEDTDDDDEDDEPLELVRSQVQQQQLQQQQNVASSQTNMLQDVTIDDYENVDELLDVLDKYIRKSRYSRMLTGWDYAAVASGGAAAAGGIDNNNIPHVPLPPQPGGAAVSSNGMAGSGKYHARSTSLTHAPFPGAKNQSGGDAGGTGLGHFQEDPASQPVGGVVGNVATSPMASNRDRYREREREKEKEKEKEKKERGRDRQSKKEKGNRDGSSDGNEEDEVPLARIQTLHRNKKPTNAESPSAVPATPAVATPAIVSSPGRGNGQPPVSESHTRNMNMDSDTMSLVLSKLSEANVKKITTRIYIEDARNFKTMVLTSLMTADQVIANVVQKFRIEPSPDWTLFELSNDLGIERPLRDWE